MCRKIWTEEKRSKTPNEVNPVENIKILRTSRDTSHAKGSPLHHINNNKINLLKSA